MDNLGQRDYAKLIKAAGVRPITFHGLPTSSVSGSGSKVSMTMEVYAHVLPDMQP